MYTHTHTRRIKKVICEHLFMDTSKTQKFLLRVTLKSCANGKSYWLIAGQSQTELSNQKTEGLVA